MLQWSEREEESFSESTGRKKGRDYRWGRREDKEIPLCSSGDKASRDNHKVKSERLAAKAKGLRISLVGI